MPSDYYQVLELPRNASPREIKHAYRRLARKHHPDFNPGDPAAEDRMEDINRAYEVLSDRLKRGEYDRYVRKVARGTSEQPKPRETYEDVRRQASALARLSPYEILGVSPSASHRDVREAFAAFVRTHGEAALSDPAAAMAYQHVKDAYRMLTRYETRRRYNADHGLPEPPAPEDEDDSPPPGVLDGLGDLAWILPTAVVVLFLLILLFIAFEPYWLR
jgi:DnaJ-class molecular chaperone